MAKQTKQILKCFLSIPSENRYKFPKGVVSSAASKAGWEVTQKEDSGLDEHSSASNYSKIAACDCLIADISTAEPTVFYEIGLGQAMGKPIIAIANRKYQDIGSKGISKNQLEGLYGRNILYYDSTLLDTSKLFDMIVARLNEQREFPEKAWIPNPLQFSLPFFIDLESLSLIDSENLAQELLLQLGFRKMHWEKELVEFDLMAELPRKDPDGFEFRELWLVTMGMRAPVEMLMEYAAMKPDYFLHRISRESKRLHEKIVREYESTITLLVMEFRKGQMGREVEFFRERLTRGRVFDERGRSSIRLRFWDADYISSLISRFPSIGYKYFSREGRIRSKTRKSYEDILKENTEIQQRLLDQNRELIEEKDKRIRAERDAVWKDISFSAAHKLGNPIFAIETDLEPLVRRINEGRVTEALEVTENLKSAIEKAKVLIDQFKSLAKSQTINFSEVKLRPVLENVCAPLKSSNVVCHVECPDDLSVWGDSDRLIECFDELIVNATRWFDKNERLIKIEASLLAKQKTPEFLDSSVKYVSIRFADNGCGVMVSEKEKIFDAFYTKRAQGTGLGLALVKRVIVGHGGEIQEIGVPGKGADFQIFLPVKKARQVKKRNQTPVIEGMKNG